MGLVKGILAKILENQKKIIEQNAELKRLLTDKESAYKAKKYDEMIQWVKALDVSVNRIMVDPQEPLNGTIHIDYGFRSQALVFDTDSGDYKTVPDGFKAINALGLLTIEDSNKIQTAIDDERERIKTRKQKKVV